MVRRVYGDRARLVYPWEPDNVGPWDLVDFEFEFDEP
jgi:hypothetical protein